MSIISQVQVMPPGFFATPKPAPRNDDGSRDDEPELLPITHVGLMDTGKKSGGDLKWHALYLNDDGILQPVGDLEIVFDDGGGDEDDD